MRSKAPASPPQLRRRRSAIVRASQTAASLDRSVCRACWSSLRPGVWGPMPRSRATTDRSSCWIAVRAVPARSTPGLPLPRAARAPDQGTLGCTLRAPARGRVRFGATRTTGLLARVMVETRSGSTSRMALPLFATSTDPRDLLGALLVAQRVLSVSELDEALEQGWRRGKRVGEALVETGLVRGRRATRALGAAPA